jgi:branched-chain amino acid transport system substrate-binding protein
LPKRTIPGATDREIKIGNIPPYSGHLSAYGVIGMTEAAYFREINGEGGITARSTSSAITTATGRRNLGPCA